MSITPETRINSLPYKVLSQLSGILDIPGSHDWKALINVLPPNSYSLAEMNQLEKANYRPGGSATMELLKDFSQQLKTVGELITYLESINNQEALLLIKQKEPVVITVQPSSAVSQVGDEVRLHCKASGFPRPRFQWYIGHNKLENQMAAEMHIKNIQLEDCGDYYCQVTNTIGSAYTNVAQIQVVPMIAPIVHGVTGPDTGSVDTFSTFQSGVDSTTREVVVYPNQDFLLTSAVMASNYQWFKNGYPLKGENKKELHFRPFEFGHEGFYSCKVNQNGSEILTMTAKLCLPPKLFPPDVKRFGNNEQYASGKVALIIANKDYCFPRQPNEELVHPINDALTLMAKLQQIDFNVFCFVNLSKEEMEKALTGFCNILKRTPGIYSLFYFCGHGFEEHGNTYLLPIDISQKWSADSAISSNDVRYQIQECNTKFDLFLFDVCRESSGFDTPPPVIERPFRSGSQCVIGYSTCPQSQAFEIRRDCNGIYMKHLSRHITENIPVSQLMNNVNEAVRDEAERHHLTNAMQPNYSCYLSKTFSLCDNILPLAGQYPDENDPINICFNYHRLPSTRVIPFPCNIICELSFEPVCSNICKVIVYVADFGDAKHCDAKIVSVKNREFDVQSESCNTERSVLSEILHRSLTFCEGSSVSAVRAAKVQRETQISTLQRFSGTFTVQLKMEFVLQDNLPQSVYLDQTFDAQNFGIVSFFY